MYHYNLQRVAHDSYLLSELNRFVNIDSWEKVVTLLENKDKSMSNEFNKVYRSYLVERDKQKATDHTKSLVLKRTRELQKKKRITTYRLYTDLRLNHGNVHAYIKNGDVSKVSLDTAERLLEYLYVV